MICGCQQFGFNKPFQDYKGGPGNKDGKRE